MWCSVWSFCFSYCSSSRYYGSTKFYLHCHATETSKLGFCNKQEQHYPIAKERVGKLLAQETFSLSCLFFLILRQVRTEYTQINRFHTACKYWQWMCGRAIVNQETLFTEFSCIQNYRFLSFYCVYIQRTSVCFTIMEIKQGKITRLW